MGATVFSAVIGNFKSQYILLYIVKTYFNVVKALNI